MDLLYKKLLNTSCVEQMLGNINTLATTDERVKYVYHQLQARGVLPLRLPPAKIASVSTEHRTTGNRFYATKDNVKAIEYYNKAISNAPPDSTEMALAYSNRSAVLLDLDKSDKALLDIARALEIGCGEKIEEKLIRRRKTCEERKPAPPQPSLLDEAASAIIFKPPTEKHPNIPCASAKLEVSYDVSCGRKIIATADIQTGEVLAVEEACVSYLEPKYFNLRCYHCYDEVYSLLPCDSCNQAMFCSVKCQSASWDEYHKYECCIIPYYLVEDSEYQGLLSLRIVLKGKHEYGTWTALSEAVSQFNEEKDPVKRGFKNVEDQNVYDSKYYSSAYALETNDGKWKHMQILLLTLRSAMFLNLLAAKTDIFDNKELSEIVEDKIVWFVGGLLLRHSMTISTNAQKIYWMSNRNEVAKLQDISGGVYSFSSLMNHSCNQNVAKINIGTSIALLALRPIKQGEEVFDNYGVHYEEDDVSQRREKLSKYRFICKCEACENNWPILPNCVTRPIELVDVIFDNILMNCTFHCKLNDYDTETTTRYIMEKLYEKIPILEEHAPCQEIIEYKGRILEWWYNYANRLD